MDQNDVGGTRNVTKTMSEGPKLVQNDVRRAENNLCGAKSDVGRIETGKNMYEVPH